MNTPTTLVRKQHTGEPGNGGQFGTHARREADVALVEPFRWDGDEGNLEQVRRFMPAYEKRLVELEREGRYPLVDRFCGHIPGIAGIQEQIAIRLIQALRRADDVKAKTAQLLADGGREVTVDDLPEEGTLRGTVILAGFMPGGEGWKVWERARLMKSEDGRGLAVLPKGKRTSMHTFGVTGRVLYLP